jgi:hypothetical protein
MNFLAYPFLLYLVDSTAELPCKVHYHPYGVCVQSRQIYAFLQVFRKSTQSQNICNEFLVVFTRYIQFAVI